MEEPNRAPSDQSVLESLEQRAGGTLRLRLSADTWRPEGEPVVRPLAEAAPAARRYQIFGEIARGGMGIVYRGRDVDLGRDVAIKVLHRSLNDDREMLQRFTEEAQIGGQLQHPGIVPVYDLGLQDDGRPYFAMKLVHGVTLATKLEKLRDPAERRDELLPLFETVCQTVAYAHARHVVHRDLKPSNVMVGSFHEVQILDWGFAKVLPQGGIADERRARRAGAARVQTVRSDGEDVGSQSRYGSAIGTPAYMPPEQATGDVDRMDERSDVFSLGAILCEILTGRPPYTKDGDGDEELLLQAGRGRLDRAFAALDASGAEPALIGLAKRCLAVQPADRPRHAGELADEIAGFLATVRQRALAAELAAAEARARASQERKARWLTVALAATVLLSALAWLWRESEHAHRIQELERGIHAAMAAASSIRLTAEKGGEEAVGSWHKAVARAREAAQLAAADGVDEGLRDRARALIVEMQRGQDAAIEARRHTRMLERLVSIRIPAEEDVAARGWASKRDEQLARDYDEVFREYGVRVDEQTPARAAELLAGPIAVALAAALDHWSMVRRSIAADAGGDTRDWRHLQRIARLLDPDDRWRNDLRDYLARPAPDRAALDRLIAAADLTELPATSILLLGDALVQAGDHLAAIDVYSAGHRHFPADFAINYRLGYLAEQARRFEQAARYYSAALAIRPNIPELTLRLALVTRRSGDLEAAIGWYRRTIEIAPDFANGYGHLGEALGAKGDVGAAVEVLNRGLERDGTNTIVLRNLCEVLQSVGQFEAAAATIRTALEPPPDRKAPPPELPRQLVLRTESLAKAQDRLLRVMTGQSRSDDADELLMMGQVAYHRGLYGRATELFDQAFEVKPELLESAPSEARQRAFHAAVRVAVVAPPNGAERPEPPRPAPERGTKETVLVATAAPAGEPGLTAERSRRLALRWLRADLAAMRARLARGELGEAAVCSTLRAWLRDASLRPIRDEDALAGLPADEAQRWRALWADVRAAIREP